jgi:hypothetical protein
MNSNIINLLKRIYTKPGVYLGEKTLAGLSSLLAGYTIRLLEEDETDTSFSGFQEFIEQKYKINLAYHWSMIISFFNPGEEDAFETFYDLLEEYSGEQFR